MAVKKIKVVITEGTGEFSVDLNGFQGKGCADVLKAFQNLGDVKTEGTKPEFKQTTCNVQHK